MVRHNEPKTSKYTPGPWRWHGYYLMQDCVNADDGDKETNPYSTPCGHPIADDGSAGGEYGEAIDINGPDARLIAAAPDLLEALKLCVIALHNVTMLHTPLDIDECDSALNKALDAITKAEM